jgi:hypothetical protein
MCSAANIPQAILRFHTTMRTTAVAFLGLLLLTACSSNQPNPEQSQKSQPAKQAEKQPQFETGRTAFQKMYLSARLWAPDVKPFRLQSQYGPDAPVAEGKAGLWRASFASPAKRAMKLFIWSGLVGPDAPERGVSFSAEDSWSATNSSTQVFDIAFLKVDSDQAFETAQKHGGAKFFEAGSNQPILFTLDWDARRNKLLWHVIYGDSFDNAKLRIAVDATSGEFDRIEK